MLNNETLLTLKLSTKNHTESLLTLLTYFSLFVLCCCLSSAEYLHAVEK